MGWSDPANDYDKYNLIYDISHKSVGRNRVSTVTNGLRSVDENETPYGFELNESSREERPIFSMIKHYPTKWQIKLAEEMKDEDITDNDPLLY